MHITGFTFNLYAENTYVVWDDSLDCLIIDPGCYMKKEEEQLKSFIIEAELNPVKLINTHCHIDHVAGNGFVADIWGLNLEMHKLDIPTLARSHEYGPTIGMDIKRSPDPSIFLEEGDTVEFGQTTLKVLFTPGHAPGHISLLDEKGGNIIVGDVLFLNSIGRTDLPGGDFDELLKSIREQLFPLDDDVKVYPGHGPGTTIGWEKRENPFVGAREENDEQGTRNVEI